MAAFSFAMWDDAIRIGEAGQAQGQGKEQAKNILKRPSSASRASQIVQKRPCGGQTKAKQPSCVPQQSLEFVPMSMAFSTCERTNRLRLGLFRP